MADNTTVDNGALTDYVVASDDDGVAQHQYMKLEFGADGVFTKVDSSNPLPVVQTDLTASGNITTQNLVPAGTATAGSAVLSGDLQGDSTAMFQVTGTYTGALSVQATVDNTTWVTLSGVSVLTNQAGVQSATVTSAATGLYGLDVAGYRQIRVTGLAAMTGTAVVTIRSSNGAGMVALDNSLPAGTAIIGALSANQSTNVAQINAVTPLMGNGASGTGALRVSIANDSTGIIVANGPIAHDSPVSTGFPVNIGLVASNATPTAVSGDQDVVRAAGDRYGQLYVVPGRVATATLSNVSSSASSVTVLASSTSRSGVIIYNDSTAVLYLKYGTTASATSFTYRIGPGDTWEMPSPIFTGTLDGIWASANGNARVTALAA